MYGNFGMFWSISSNLSQNWATAEHLQCSFRNLVLSTHRNKNLTAIDMLISIVWLELKKGWSLPRCQVWPKLCWIGFGSESNESWLPKPVAALHNCQQCSAPKPVLLATVPISTWISSLEVTSWWSQQHTHKRKIPNKGIQQMNATRYCSFSYPNNQATSLLEMPPWWIRGGLWVEIRLLAAMLDLTSRSWIGRSLHVGNGLQHNNYLERT